MIARRAFIGAGLTVLATPIACAQTNDPIVVDSAAAPELADWCAQLKQRALAWWPRINEELASPGYVPPDRVNLIVSISKPTGWAGPAQPTTVNLNAAFSEAHPQHLNNIAHEMVHVVQSYHGRIKRWLFEGVADYVRYYGLFPQDPERFFPVEGADYRKGYNMAAALLDWVERERGVGSVRALNAAMRQGQDGETVLAQLAGVPLDQAWSQVMADLAAGSPAQVS